jgi:hypothetical protein
MQALCERDFGVSDPPVLRKASSIASSTITSCQEARRQQSELQSTASQTAGAIAAASCPAADADGARPGRVAPVPDMRTLARAIGWRATYRQLATLGAASWHRVDAVGPSPRSRASHTVCFAAGKVLVFGGGCDGGTRWLTYISNTLAARK